MACLLDTLLVGVPQEIAQAIGAPASTGAAAAVDPTGNLLDPSAFGDAGFNLCNIVIDLLTGVGT